MKIYEELLGGKVVWENTILLLTKIDYNPIEYGEKNDWLKEIFKKEQEANQILKNVFGAEPLASVALSQ